MIHWEQVVSSLLDPAEAGWQRLGRLSPKAIQLADRLTRSPLGLRWRFSVKGGTIYAKRRVDTPS